MGGLQQTVGTYLEHVSAHAIEDALACLAPDFILEFEGTGVTLTKAQTARALEWDVGANGRLDWRVVEEVPPLVTIVGSEGNDFLDLIGVGSLDFQSVYTVAAAGLISHQLHEVSRGEVSFEDAMAPLTAWADS